MLEIKYPHVCENKDDFDLVVKIECVNGEEFNKPISYPCAIVDISFQCGDRDWCEFAFLYPSQLKEIIKNSKFADIINESV